MPQVTHSPIDNRLNEKSSINEEWWNNKDIKIITASMIPRAIKKDVSFLKLNHNSRVEYSHSLFNNSHLAKLITNFGQETIAQSKIISVIAWVNTNVSATIIHLRSPSFNWFRTTNKKWLNDQLTINEAAWTLNLVIAILDILISLSFSRQLNMINKNWT